MYSLCENIVDMSYSMMNPENWILGNKNSCQVFSISLPYYKLHNTLHEYIYVACRIILFVHFLYFRGTSMFLIALFFSVLNPIGDFLYRWMTVSLC